MTSAVESVDDRVLELLDKGHTRRDFFEVVRLCREAGLTQAPTFVAFTPWTTMEAYCELLSVIAELDLVPNVAPIQLAIRLLIPAGSRLLERPEVLEIIGDFDQAALSYRWAHPDPRMDELCKGIQELVKRAEGRRATRLEIFRQVWDLAHQGAAPPLPDDSDRLDRAAIPYINEPWYC